ncbi:MAG TPA: sigma-70 family RNA polymerase sigma factor, partial [Pyrinomonadaceae bacterium]|nr:sigma-70 family RNA polymerase sigma factor [Pyrinomonadaceae bacterium]
IRIFVTKGFSDAEDLADEVMDRVANRLPEIRETYVGEPVRYFHGVARNVILERGRRREIATDELPVGPTNTSPDSDEYECLLKCLKFLSEDTRELILDYYLYQGRDKIELHRVMAAELGITDGALRGRAFQLRSRLEKCIANCVSAADKTKSGSGSINTGVLF